MTSRSPGWRRRPTIRRTGRWTCWSRPTPTPRSRRPCSSPWPTCSTSRSTCCSSTPPAPTSSATPRTPRPRTAIRPPTPPAADAAGAGDGGRQAGFRRYGHSKDSRGDLPQIIIGLAVTREGIPVRVWCWPGNTSDQSVLPQVKDDLRAWRLGRVVTVVDRGFSSAANLDYLRRAGGHFIAGERMRAGTPHVEEVLARQGRYRAVRDNLRVKEIRLDSAPELRWVLCHNPDQAVRQAAQREAAVERIRAELARIAAARSRLATAKPTTTAATRRREAELAAHTRAECALRDHPAL